MKLFEKEYSGESLADVSRDVTEAFDSDYNPLLDSIPLDEHGFPTGTFCVAIIWVNH